MINPHNDSAFYAYADWVLSQEIAWDEEQQTTIQSESLKLADELSSSPYAWPGGYPLFGIFSDGGACCHLCAKLEREAIGTTTGSDGWQLVAIEVNYEDTKLFCAHCDSRIESAYGENN